MSTGAVSVIGRAILILLALAGAGCSPESTRLSPASLGLSAPNCAPGTFAGTMTGNCPQPVR